MLTEKMDEVLARIEAEQGFNSYFWNCKAQHAALTGDAEAATAYMQKSYEAGLTTVVFWEPVFNLLDNHAEFQAVKARIVARGNQERADLGLEPYRPALGL